MASHYDAHERQRTSRHDSFHRPRDQEPSRHRKHSAGYASRGSTRGGEADTVRGSSGSERKAFRRSYDPRDSAYYAPPPSVDHGRPHRRGSPSRRRHSWPPQPFVEEESRSLAREAGAQALWRDIQRAEAPPSRGIIDQEQIIEEVPEYRTTVAKPDENNVNPSDLKYNAKTHSTGILTPPTSEDERARKLRRKPSKLNTKLEDAVPEMSKRTSSPYAFSKPAPLTQGFSSSRQFLSPDSVTPPPSGSEPRRHTQSISTSKPSTPRVETRRTSPGARFGQDYFSSFGSGENAVFDDERHKQRRGPSPPRDEPTVPTPSSRTSVVDFAPNQSVPPARKHLGARRNTDTLNAVPSLPHLHVDKTRRPSPLMASNALSELDDFAVSSAPGTPGTLEVCPMSREGSYVSSRGVSPAGSIVSAISAASYVSSASRREHSPRRSPRTSWEYPHDKQTSSPREDSVSSSHPSTPSPQTPDDSPRLPRTDLDWSVLIAANTARRPKTSSRLQQSMRQESVDDVRRPHGPGRTHTSSSLPYPVDDTSGFAGSYMPSEREYQYLPARTLGKPSDGVSQTLSRAASPSRTARASTIDQPSRPPFYSSHSATTGLKTDDRYKPDDKAKAFAASSQTRRELAILLKKGLPDCSRSDPVAGYDDWYTVIGAPQLVFCPDCVDKVFERTIFRPSVRRMPQLNLDSKIQCSFGASHWARLAWVLTLQQHRTDFTLLKDVVEIEETSEPCPGHKEAVRTWYGLRDSEGLYVRDFHLCYADVRKLERLLPMLNGFFVPLPSRASHGKYKCAFRVDSNRFNVYLDALITTHERSLNTHKVPDRIAFIDLVERKTQLRDCTKDTLLIGGLWHFMPRIPEFTICEDCFDAIVEPEVKRNNDLAMRFNRTIQPAYGEGLGSSCQLYSRRMRRVFQRAIEDNDLRYLARKAKERREAELRLQERYQDVIRKAKRLSKEGTGTGDDEKRLNRELQVITDEWKTRWE